MTFMKHLDVKIVIFILIIFGPLFGYSQKWGREGLIYVTEVAINNKNLVDFIKERVFSVVDSLIEPQTPYIRYIITFEKHPWIKSYDYNVSIGAYGEPEKFYDDRYDEFIERGYSHNSYVTFIEGRKILVHSDADNPYIDITNKKIRINQKTDMWYYTGLTWNIAMKGGRLIAVNLGLDRHPDIESDKSIKKDFYLFQKECIKEMRIYRLTEYIQFDSISPPSFINLPNVVEQSECKQNGTGRL